MLGYDISWAAFNIIEVMSASKFTFKVRWTGQLWTDPHWGRSWWRRGGLRPEATLKKHDTDTHEWFGTLLSALLMS